jgi:hypothetical protein
MSQPTRQEKDAPDVFERENPEAGFFLTVLTGKRLAGAVLLIGDGGQQKSRTEAKGTITCLIR